MKRSKFTEEQILEIVREAEAGRKVADGVSQERHQRADVLPLEGEVRRDGGQRDAAPEAARGRESAIEEDRRRSDARQSGAEGGGRKKVVSPSARRVAVGWLRTGRHESAALVPGARAQTASWRYQRSRQCPTDDRVAGTELQAHAAVALAVWVSSAACPGRTRWPGR